MHKQEHIHRPCPGCFVGCCYDTKITTGPYAGYYATSGPGGEPFEGSGAILRIMEPGSYIYLADLYDRLGIECSMAGCTMAMAIEAYEKGLITKEQTGGLELKWGDVEVAEALLRKMVNREGIGERPGDGNEAGRRGDRRGRPKLRGQHQGVGDEPSRLEIGLGDLFLADRRQRGGLDGHGRRLLSAANRMRVFPNSRTRWTCRSNPWKPR